VWVAPLIVGAVVLSLLSIFLFYLAFSVGVLLWAMDCYRRRELHLEFPPFTFILVCFLGLVVVSIFLSSDPLSSARYLKKLVKVFLIFLIYTYATERQIAEGLKWIFWVLGVSALVGIMQTLWLDQTDLLNRIVGFMSHWMTFSGQLMIGTVSLSGYLLFFILRGERRRWSLFAGYFLIFLSLTTALILTFTRSAWIGTVGGLLLMLAIYRLRWAVFGGLTILFIFLLLPVPFQERFYSSFDPSDTTTRGRIELLKTGANLILDNPWTGVGPRMVQEKALEYREEKELPDYLYQHFHNNLLQISAEMGIPAALVWSALWIWIIRDLLQLKRTAGSRPFLNCLAVNGICVLFAVQLAGLLEYNFGDSEIAILLFFFVTVPYVAGRGRSEVGA